MNQAFLLHALRLPLLAALAFNGAVVLVTPWHRAHPAVDRTASPRLPAETIGSLPPPLERPPQAAGPLQSRSSIPGDPQAAPGLTPASDNGVEPTTEAEQQPHSGDESQHTWAEDMPTPAQPLAAVGTKLVQLNHRSSVLSRPVAQAAGRLSQWLAHLDASPATASDPVAEPVAAPSSESSRQTGQLDPAGAAEQLRIVIRNPLRNGYPVAFLIDERVQSLAPGKQLVIPATQATVRFDRGRSFGEARRDLDAGLYEFLVTADGWKLQRQERQDRSASQP